jgi:hypothetical protein
MSKAVVSLLVLLFVTANPGVGWADGRLVRTAETLDEPRGYCLDIAGFGATIRLDDPLQAHTCKYGAALDDQTFERMATGAIKATSSGRCLAASALRAGAALLVRPCAQAPAQRWPGDA